ncbi:twin-arginine translocase TatA/TatE family subunit [Paratractidigestivibacter sp.]|uniref:twin-arginine translocase TatA/TatE family subunit n=1 Tax=Paratractidigestivibacter sp. TaxID=2847316 RepID=UPI002ABD3F42|nr:twin-arginine translocase TatA/TatE family subunit [Paratractidigestivibacter sp.]
MILGMGVPELAVILVVILVIFGPKNLPKLGSSLGKTVKNFREGMNGAADDAAAEVSEVVADVADAEDADA